MKTWGIIIHRSPARFFAPVMVAVGVALLFVSREWVGLWTETGGWVARTATLLMPLAAGAGALASATWVSSGAALSVASSVRSWSAQRLPHVAAATLYSLGSYGVVTAVAWVTSTRAAGAGVPSPAYSLLGAGLVLIFVGLGSVVGVLLPSPLFTPFGVILVCLFGQSLLRVPGGQYVQMSVRPFALVVVWVSAVILLGLAVAVRPRDRRVTAWSWRGRPAWVGGTVPVAVLVIVLAGLLNGARPMQSERDPEPVCAGSPRLCLWPDHESFRAPLNAATDRLAHRLPSAMRMPDQFSESGLGGGNPLQLPPPWFAYSSMASAIMEDSFDLSCVPQDPGAQKSFYAHDFALLLWLMMTANGGPPPPDVHGGPPGVDLEEVAGVVASPAADQEAWVARHVTALQAVKCS